MKKLFIAAFMIAAGLSATVALNHYRVVTTRGGDEAGAVNNATASADAEAPAVKAFTVTGANYSFSPSTLAVKKGDRVRIVFENIEGFHDFNIDELNVATKQFRAVGSEAVEFMADKAGTFEYYCSVGSHRVLGMKGTLVVEE